MSDPSLWTHDLRSEAVDHKRVKSHNMKWALGDRSDRSHISGLGLGISPQQSIRHVPEKRQPRIHQFRREHDHNMGKLSKQVNTARKLDYLAEQSATDSEPSDEDVVDGERAAPPDRDITYSFDALQGPRAGQDVLSVALARAVEKFEGQETEKLVKEEYEVVGQETASRETSAKSLDGPISDVDGFELL
ncbi:MAG: hypothetical protein M1825_002169 [Sarcosagium campestre]|nr:MAG: hypothetical protein M1825_002169 [Sarcosagium campestre]